ncbi:MAG: recombinase family protein [Oscillospiraceae bacterium]|nr:recombinase family protein [Oscillospiraceae bacterium]
MTYGYLRVSTREQNEERQRIALEKFGISVERMYLDKQSGKDFARPAYRRLLRRLRPGDLLVLPSIDRLGRNYHEILEQWRLLTKKMRVGIVVLDMPLLDTRREQGLTETLITDIVLQLLSYVAQSERELLRSRQEAGIAAAKARGVQFGRRAMPRPPGFEARCHAWRSGHLTSRQAAACLGVSQTTFLKWAHDSE